MKTVKVQPPAGGIDPGDPVEPRMGHPDGLEDGGPVAVLTAQAGVQDGGPSQQVSFGGCGAINVGKRSLSEEPQRAFYIVALEQLHNAAASFVHGFVERV
jgi:hypothetical protein